MFNQKTRIATISVALALVMAACAAPATPAPTTAPVAAATEAPAAATEMPAATEAPAAATEVPAATEAPAVEATAEVTSTEAMTTTEAMTETAVAAVTLPEVDPLTLEGEIAVAGSSTVFPLSEKMAEVFKDEGFKGDVTIASIGTGAGMERFCKGEIDIANASRAITEKEIATCQSNSIEPIEFRVGTDALSIVVNPENPVQNLTIAQVADIFSGTITNWSQIDPAFDMPIKLYSPGTDSGTFDYFAEVVFSAATADLSGDARATKRKEFALAGKAQLSENDNVLVQGVEGDKGAIGYFGFAYYVGEGSKLKAVQIEGVTPDEKTAESGEYKLARPLFIYSTAKVMTEKPQVAGYINFYLTYVNDNIISVGYFPASAESLNAAKQAFVDATK